ncbi:MAG: FAD:protein FMN transferase [Armatimonadota bacterium]|nr:FAD:protein FMN transferase [Armatimonadota bacterium]MDR7444323.1 FAD:protein FMN transferase [Armatimonadota bacterium]MDR7569686.1 FAD:protein FMN transferase [Armatimonadota bacterium]MDR7614810.1 FAD:protein FMN transferase [Armatimonadota bacterium]
MNPRLFVHDFRAMGCGFRICLGAASRTVAQTAVWHARCLIERMEQALSRFRLDSELVHLNGSGGRSMRVSPLLWIAIRLALWAAEITGGLYDPTLGPREEACMGWLGRWRRVRLDPRTRSVRLPPGLELDLGGVGKSFAAEVVADFLGRYGPCLVDAGGDVAVRGMPGKGQGWPVAVAGPYGSPKPLGTVWMWKGGLATSGVDVRRHILDPRTGGSAETDVVCATVWAPTAVEANAHSLALVVLGFEAARAYLRGRPGIRALLVRRDGSVYATPRFALKDVEG